MKRMVPPKWMASGPAGATITYEAAEEDGTDGAVTPECTPPSGSTFPLGTTTVDRIETDFSGTAVSGKFTVTVKTTPPTTKRQCRDGVWKNFASPGFDSERECTHYVERSHGRDNDRDKDRDRGNDRDDRDRDRDKKRDRD